ncbi:hypothetical protein L9F63_016172 [Diploptera punctata]|uniref:Lipase domain-containing protein n=1 Tax=Diploptera punctata TaxID=6984 RepID=A0AAD8EHX6_DIPPU|nr:hypothetical protein L9F63_016172 [Diploptera punctata]
MLFYKALFAVLVSVASVASYPANNRNCWIQQLPPGVKNWMLIPNDRGEPQLAILDEVTIPQVGNVTDDVKFYLYTRKNPNGFILLVDNAELLKESSFNSSNPTKILIHGYEGSITSPVITKSTAAFLNNDDYNVIGVDWSKLSQTPYYNIAVNSTKPVGKYVAKLVDFLIAKGGAHLSDIHIIGHSLGAHVSGFAGAAVSTGKIGRVTGLDAAAPLFDNVTSENRLNKYDANLVDAIHTDVKFLGLEIPVGHLDFYPDGGDNQPDCKHSLSVFCNHAIAVEYFVNSITNKTEYPAVECSTLNDAVEGDCHGGDSAIMGENLKYKKYGIYYVSI